MDSNGPLNLSQIFSPAATLKSIKAHQHNELLFRLKNRNVSGLKIPLRYVTKKSLKSSGSSVCSVKSVCNSAGKEGSLNTRGDCEGSGKSGEASVELSESGSDSPSDSRSRQSKSLQSENRSAWLPFSGSAKAALRAAMYFIAKRRVVIFVSFSLAAGAWVVAMWGMTLLRDSKAILISLILFLSLALAVFRLYLLSGAGFCFALCDLLGFVFSFSESEDGLDASVILRTDLGRSEYFSPFGEAAASYSPLLLGSGKDARRSDSPSNSSNGSMVSQRRIICHSHFTDGWRRRLTQQSCLLAPVFNAMNYHRGACSGFAWLTLCYIRSGASRAGFWSDRTLESPRFFDCVRVLAVRPQLRHCLWLTVVQILSCLPPLWENWLRTRHTCRLKRSDMKRGISAVRAKELSSLQDVPIYFDF